MEVHIYFNRERVHCKSARSISMPFIEVREGENKKVESCWTKRLAPLLNRPCTTALIFPPQKPLLGELKYMPM